MDPEQASLKRRKDLERAHRRLVIARMVFKIAVVFDAVLFLTGFVICPYAVHGNRMFPKLRDGDCAIVLKIGQYQRGDVVTFRRGEVRFFSRIAAMEEDHVVIGQEGFQINGFVPAEEVFYETGSDEPVDVVLRAGERFLLNDYRSDQTDSRQFGTINASEIDGKVIFLFRWRGF